MTEKPRSRYRNPATLPGLRIRLMFLCRYSPRPGYVQLQQVRWATEEVVFHWHPWTEDGIRSGYLSATYHLIYATQCGQGRLQDSVLLYVKSHYALRLARGVGVHAPALSSGPAQLVAGSDPGGVRCRR